MNAYIVSYDLVTPGKNSERVIEQIKKNPGWARIGNSAYIVLSDQSPKEIRDVIASQLNPKDRVLVSAVKAPGAWIGLTDEVSQWLKKNLK